MKKILFLFALILAFSSAYASTADNNKSEKSTLFTENFQPAELNIPVLSDNLNHVESCEFKVDLTITLKSGLTIHVEGTATIYGVTCLQLIQSVATV